MIFFSLCIRILKRKQGWKLLILKVISWKILKSGDFGSSCQTPLHNEGGLLMAELFSELDQIDNLEDFKVYRSKLIKKKRFLEAKGAVAEEKRGIQVK